MCGCVYTCVGVRGVREWIVTLLGLNSRLCLWLMAELV